MTRVPASLARILPVPSILSIAVLVLTVGCARQEPPPGTRPDNSPPRTVELGPEYGSEVPGFDGAARVRFDEPLANPRNLGRDIVGSPAGRYDVKPGRSGLEVRPEDGWRDSVVYYIRLPSGISDLLRNQTDEPVEWLFSTGGPVPDTEVSGRAIDRVTARGTPGIRLLFLAADSVPYSVVSDTGGVFRLPGLPYESYEAAAFEDQDRDFTYDPEFEPGGTAQFALDETAPTAQLELFVLPADTTPPFLSGATAQDSFTLRVEFDDPLDPEADLSEASVTVRDADTGEALETAEFVVGDLPPPEIPEEADAGAEEEPGEEEEVEVAAVAEPLPDLEPASTYVTVRLTGPLMPGTYEVAVDGVPNLRGLEGGGSTEFTYERPPEPEPEPEPEEQEPGEPSEQEPDEPQQDQPQQEMPEQPDPDSEPEETQP